MIYDNYIFDLYGTLIDIHTDESTPQLWEFMADYLKDNFKVSYSAASLNEIYLKLCAKETAALSKRNGSKYPEIKIEWVWQKIIGKDCSDDEMRLLCNTFREKSRDKFQVYSKVTENLQALKALGKGIYLLSNAQRLFTEKELEDTKLTSYFDDIFISSDFEIKKPDSNFIKALMDKHHLTLDHTVMVGNEVIADMGSAIAAGIDGIYLNTYSHTDAELEKDFEAIGAADSDVNITIINDGPKSFESLLLI